MRSFPKGLQFLSLAAFFLRTVGRTFYIISALLYLQHEDNAIENDFLSLCMCSNNPMQPMTIFPKSYIFWVMISYTLEFEVYFLSFKVRVWVTSTSCLCGFLEGPRTDNVFLAFVVCIEYASAKCSNMSPSYPLCSSSQKLKWKFIQDMFFMLEVKLACLLKILKKYAVFSNTRWY